MRELLASPPPPPRPPACSLGNATSDRAAFEYLASLHFAPCGRRRPVALRYTGYMTANVAQGQPTGHGLGFARSKTSCCRCTLPLCIVVRSLLSRGPGCGQAGPSPRVETQRSQT